MKPLRFGPVPPVILRLSFAILTALALAILAAGFFIPYPPGHGESIFAHFFSLV